MIPTLMINGSGEDGEEGRACEFLCCRQRLRSVRSVTGIHTACDVAVGNGSIGAHVVGSTTTTGVIISVCWTLRFVVGGV